MSKASDYAFACEARRQKYPAPYKTRASPSAPVIRVGDDASLEFALTNETTLYIPADEVEDFIAWLRATFEENP